MFNLSFMPNLNNPNTVLGIIYMTSHENVCNVIDVVNRFLKLQQNNIVYRHFVEIIAYHCHASPLKFISRLFDVITKENEKLIVDVINNKIVIDAIKRSYLNSNHFDRRAVINIAKNLQKYMSEENVLEILRGKVSDPVFVAFGYHPVIAKDIELQKKWIFTVASNPVYAIQSMPWYITDEAIEVAATYSLYKTIRFIEEFFKEEHSSQEKESLFTLQTLRRIISTYAVSESSSHVGKLLNVIKMYEGR